MKKSALLAALATLASFSLVPLIAHAGAMMPGAAYPDSPAASHIAAGKMIYAANGRRLAPVYRVVGDGSVQLIMEGRLLTIPATILTDVKGKLIASQTKTQLLR